MKLSHLLQCALLTSALLVPNRLLAQNQAGGIVPPEVIALNNDIDDIDKLRILNPLKLTPQQLDQMIDAIKKAQDSYNKSLADAAVPPIREIAKDIKETRRKMLSGAPIPKDLDEKVKKIQEDFVKRRNTEDFNTLKGLADTMKKIMTPAQVKQCASMARKFLEEQGKEVKPDEDKLFNYYVLGTFIVYPRIVPLLQDLRNAANSASARPSPYRREARR